MYVAVMVGEPLYRSGRGKDGISWWTISLRLCLAMNYERASRMLYVQESMELSK